MNFKFIYLLVFQLFFVSSFAQSTCYLMGLKIGKNSYFTYQSLKLNEDNTFILTVLFDMQYSTCGIYEINNDLIELSEFKINNENLNLDYCEEPHIIKSIINSDFETEPFEKLKLVKDKLFLLDQKERKIKRVKENFIRTNLFADLFGKTYLYKEIDCDELYRIQQN